ncbi:hypothetical protein H9X96_21870 [Pedobacter sp. N36a]|uniref:hypothetical protein n=1 Tax=Pedobacter sp. N36a TaxID=2767996 RepID=UPI0016575CD3|nr:hypothetical protein [Pedobacter sp. N36a]MBC8988407.1 hypothetical protein [Pedobacter sp. N36a]
MKKIVLKLTLILIFFCGSSFKFGFERIQTISTAINLLGSSKVKMNEYLASKSFSLDSEYKQILEYRKTTETAFYTYTTVYSNGMVNAISWTEVATYGNEIVNELLNDDFQSIESNSRTNIYSYRNIRKNILVTLILNGSGNQVNVTIGALDPKKPIKK